MKNTKEVIKSSEKNFSQLTNIAFLQERINQTKNQEYKLILVYEADKSEVNWNALCDMRRHGQLQEEHLSEQLVCDHNWKSRFSEKRGSWRLCAKCGKED